jgi:DnaK suppressor protein
MEQMVEDNKALVQRELEHVRYQITALEVSLRDKPEYGLGSGAPAVTRWELDKALLEHLRERAESLERTLSQTGSGAYGICEKCGMPIHPDRLAILPDTRVCVRCARAYEQGESD